ncbi:MAG: ATP-binding protein [Gemmatimonadota bacterium]
MTAPLALCVRHSRPGAQSVPESVALRVPSDVNHVEAVVELMIRHCFAGQSPSTRAVFRLRVALAEALANAICSGNRQDPAKGVTVSAELLPDLIRLSVADEGDGFDPATVLSPTDQDALERECGRGLFIIRNMALQVEFNERGNIIWMTLPRC